MASNLGTVFVELSLDDKVYRQRLGEVLTSTETTAKGIETSWKALGTKSDAVFNSQRLAAENAYTLISKAGTFSAEEVARAQKASADKITSINDQQFGKHTSLIDGLKANWIAATAAMAAAWMLVNKAVGYMDEGAKALQIESSFKIMAESAGINSASLIGSMKAATKETVDDSDLMQKAVKLMLLDFDAKQIQEFSSVVVTSSQFAGKTVSETFDALGDAIANRTPKALRALGALAPEQMKIFQAAVKGGATSTDVLALAVANLELKQLQLQGTQDGASLSLQRFHTQVKETGETLGKVLIVGMREAYAVFQGFGVASLEVSSGIWKILEARNAFAAAVHFGDAKKEYEDAAKAFGQMAADDKAAAASLRTAMIDNITGTSAAEAKATAESIAGGQAKVASEMAKFKAIQDAAKGEKDILKALLDENKKVYETEIEMADHASKRKVLAGSNELNFALDTLDQKEEALNKFYDAQADVINKTVKNETAKQAKLKALDADYNKQWQKYEDQRAEKSEQVIEFQKKGYSSYITWEKKQETNMIEFARTQGGLRSKIDAKTWDDMYEYEQLTGRKMTADQRANAELTLREYKDTFVGGAKAALLDLRNCTYTWGKASEEMVKGTASAMQSSMSGVFFDAFQGNLKSAGDYFTAFTTSLEKTFADVLSKLIMKAIEDQIVLSFGASWTDAAKSVLGVVGKVLGYAADWLFGSSDATTTSGLAGGDIYQIAYGGLIPGYAMGGDSYANDTIHAMLSPGEYVVPRSVVSAIASQGTRGDTMLAHINPQEAALLKAMGGKGTVNERTGLPQFFADSEWGDIGFGWKKAADRYAPPGANINPLYTGLSFEDVRAIPGGSNDPYTSKAKGAWTWDKQNNAYYFPTGRGEYGEDEFMRHLRPGENNDPSNFLDRITTEGSRIFGSINETIGPMVPSILMAVMGAAAGGAGAIAAGVVSSAGVGAVAGAVGGALGSVPAVAESGSLLPLLIGTVLGAAGGAIGGALFGTAAQTAEGAAEDAYMASILAGGSEDMAQAAYNDTLGQGIITSLVKTAGKTLVKAWAYDQIQSIGEAGSGGTLKVASEGVTGGEGLGLLIGGMPKDMSSQFSFSARNGLDYVPYDNFPARLHKGERVQTAEQAKGGGGFNGTIKVYLDGQEIPGRVKIIADGVVVDRNRRGVNARTRVYQ